MKGKNKVVRIVIWGVLILGTLLASFVNSSFQFVVPRFYHAIFIVTLLIMLLGMSWLIFSKGIKYMVFISIPYIIFFILLETGTRIWLIHFAKRSERILYVDQFTSPAQLDLETVYVPHHYTLYNLRPNFSTSEGTVHNRLGFRDHRELLPEANVIRIVFIGGSTTYTIGIKENTQIFSYGLEQRLNDYYQDRLDGYRIEVINAGMGGATSAENLLRLMFFVSEISPDLVVIQHGINDVWPRCTKAQIQSDFSNYRKLWEKPETLETDFLALGRPIASALPLTIMKKSVFFKYLLRRIGFPVDASITHSYDDTSHTVNVLHIYAMINQSNITSDGENAQYLTQNSPKYFERNTRYMLAICRSLGSQVLLATEAYDPQKAKSAWNVAMPQHNALLARIAEEEHVLFYDFANEMSSDDGYMGDEFHVNQRGSDLKRDLFFQYFVEHRIIPQLQAQKANSHSLNK